MKTQKKQSSFYNRHFFLVEGTKGTLSHDYAMTCLSAYMYRQFPNIPTNSNIDFDLSKCMRASLENFGIFTFLICYFFQYFVGTSDTLSVQMTCLSAHMYRQISKCTDKNSKKHYWGGQLPPPPPAPPLATLMVGANVHGATSASAHKQAGAGRAAPTADPAPHWAQFGSHDMIVLIPCNFPHQLNFYTSNLTSIITLPTLWPSAVRSKKTCGFAMAPVANPRRKTEENAILSHVVETRPTKEWHDWAERENADVQSCTVAAMHASCANKGGLWTNAITGYTLGYVRMGYFYACMFYVRQYSYRAPVIFIR